MPQTTIPQTTNQQTGTTMPQTTNQQTGTTMPQTTISTPTGSGTGTTMPQTTTSSTPTGTGTTTTSSTPTGTGTTTTFKSGITTTNPLGTIPITTHGYKMSNGLFNGVDTNPQTNVYQKNFDGTSNIYAPNIFHSMEAFSPLNLYDDKYSPY
jgi:hypothetical protein